MLCILRFQLKSYKCICDCCTVPQTTSALERKKTQVERLEEQLTKLEVNATDKEENKEIALGTSKLNYLDPRISVAW